MAGETEDKIPMPFKNFPEKAGSFTGLVESTIDSTICVNQPAFSAIKPISNETDDHETILYHAGWAIKRARDVISKGQEELAARETVQEDSQVLYGNKRDALAVISSLGEDVKQSDESYRFCAHANVLPFFTFLHTVVESILSPHNIQREKSNILKYCLEQISVNKELRDKWNELLTPGTDAITSVVVLQRIVTFFLKSKQQIFREKEGLKPIKNSMSLRQQVKGSKSVSKSSKLPVMKTPEITTR